MCFLEKSWSYCQHLALLAVLAGLGYVPAPTASLSRDHLLLAPLWLQAASAGKAGCAVGLDASSDHTNPAGTPLEGQEPASAVDMVRTIATARVVMPKTVVRLSAGRLSLSLTDQVGLRPVSEACSGAAKPGSAAVRAFKLYQKLQASQTPAWIELFCAAAGQQMPELLLERTLQLLSAEQVKRKVCRQCASWQAPTPSLTAISC